MEICFILVEPQQAENIGAAARALTTMGFGDLRLVNAYLQHHHRARVIAHGSGPLLAATQSFPTLSAALHDVDFVIGTTAKPRHQRDLGYRADELLQLLNGKGDTVRRSAIVFGREDQGLGKEELAHCDCLSSIPMHSNFPSLNLGQAVMLYAYSLQFVQAPIPASAVGAGELRQLKTNLAQLLLDNRIETSSPAYRWVMERLAASSARDVRMLHTLYRQLANTSSTDTGE